MNNCWRCPPPLQTLHAIRWFWSGGRALSDYRLRTGGAGAGVRCLLNSRRARARPLQQQQLPTESMGPTLKPCFAIRAFASGSCRSFCTSRAQVGVWSFTIRFVQLRAARHQRALRDLLAAGFSGDLRRGKNRGHLVDDRLNPAMLLGTFCPGRHRPVTDCRFPAVQCWRSMRSFWSASVWRHAGRRTLVW
ncbi:fucose permease [Klebsiella pneumoniae]|uniref:Fucose permease n=1 Tax=Klebsiella pneumoniae TaxID=573 RepID=A0A2X3F2Z8_KLEPN|nr:fucose permease [Klebsiella pneumoniae]